MNKDTAVVLFNELPWQPEYELETRLNVLVFELEVTMHVRLKGYRTCFM